MTIQAGDTAPDFEQDTINGSIRFHEWMGRSWCILFSQPRGGRRGLDGSAPELAQIARLKPEWNRRGIKVVGLAVDPADNQNDRDAGGWTLNFPVIADADGSVSALYGAASPDTGGLMRRIYIIDPKKTVRLVRTFPPGTVCDFNEMLSLIDCLQLADGLSSGRDLRN